MKIFVLLVASVLVFSGSALAESVKIDLNAVTSDGIGKKLGTITATDTPQGLSLKVEIQGITEGAHGFHVHTNPSCAGVAPDGKTTGAALAAGGHYDPDNTNMHLGPDGKGHKGDLPFITADKNGVVDTTVIAPRLTVKDIRNRAIMVHAGGDNYSDQPVALGGGGARIACGIVK